MENEPKKEQRKPIVVKELDKSTDKVDFSKLKKGDQFQVLTRYLNDVCAINKSTLQIVADMYVLMEFICAKMGIDVKKLKAEIAKSLKQQQDQNIKVAKEELEQAAKKQA